MSNDRRDDRDPDDSAEKDWSPWLDDESSEEELPSFGHDSDSDEGDYQDDETPLDESLDEFSEDREDSRGFSHASTVAGAVAGGQAVRAVPGGHRHSRPADDGDDAYDRSPELEDAWDDREPPEAGYGGVAARLADNWPLGLIAVAVVALILLAAGGYGIMKQRSAMEQEIRELQARLATTAEPEEVGNTRAALAALRDDNQALQEALSALRDENRQLTDTLAGLEQQLLVQREAAARAAPIPATASPPQPAASTRPPPAAATTANGWFVNFGSFGERRVADQWATRLRPEAGRVTVSATQRDGSTFYRVRIVGIPSDSQAQAIARRLEQEHNLPRLWVGRE